VPPSVLHKKSNAGAHLQTFPYPLSNGRPTKLVSQLQLLHGDVAFARPVTSSKYWCPPPKSTNSRGESRSWDWWPYRHMASAELEPITGVWGLCLQRGPGAEPLVMGRSPPWSWTLVLSYAWNGAKMLCLWAVLWSSSVKEPWRLPARLQGAPIKNNPLGKIHYLSFCKRFFRQIYSFHRGGFAPHTLLISSQYLLWFENYNHLNLKVQFSKWTIYNRFRSCVVETGGHWHWEQSV